MNGSGASLVASQSSPANTAAPLTAPQQSGPDVPQGTAERPHQGRSLTFQTLASLCAEVDAEGPRRWLVRGIWPAGAYGVHAAEPKAGKTWNAYDLAVSVASGTPWLGLHPVDTTGPVVVFAGEGGKGNVVRRLRAIAAARGLRAETLPVVVCTRAPHLADDGHLREMERALDEVRPALVVLDPLYLAAGGANGTDLYAMGRLLERPQHIAERVGAALLVVTHYNRSKDLRGAARITGAGPAEWGRVLLSAAVVSRSTDAETMATTVVLDIDVQGGEVPDRTLRVRRTVRAVDPDDLDSALDYRTDDPDRPQGGPTPRPDDLPTRVLAALDAQPGHQPITITALIGWLRDQHPDAPPDRTVLSRVLNGLAQAGDAGYVDGPRGRKDWYRRGQR